MKWKRLALRQFGMRAGEGLLTDMRAVRKDYFLGPLRDPVAAERAALRRNP